MTRPCWTDVSARMTARRSACFSCASRAAGSTASSLASFFRDTIEEDYQKRRIK